VLVNNAGIFFTKPFTDYTAEVLPNCTRSQVEIAKPQVDCLLSVGGRYSRESDLFMGGAARRSRPQFAGSLGFLDETLQRRIEDLVAGAAHPFVPDHSVGIEDFRGKVWKVFD
jgi:hypothetical protein